MKVFCFKATCFILGFMILSYALGSLADRIAPMNVYSNGEAEKLRTLMENRDSLQAISLGNSHSDAIDFETLGLKGQSLARGGTDLFEVNLYAKSVAPKLPRLETVFVAISYFSFARNNLLSEDTRNLRIELYAMLPTWAPLPGDIESLLLGKMHRYFRIMSVVRPDSWHNVFETALANHPVVEDSSTSLVKSTTPWGECLHYPADQLDAIGNEIGYKAARTHLMFLDLDPEIQVQSFQVLADTIKMLQRRGIRVILFSPPYYAAYNQRFSEIAPEMIQSMHQAVEDLQTQFDVEYYDATSVAEFSTHPELFFNSDHLNECGKRGFTEYLQKEMADHEGDPSVRRSFGR